MDTWLANTECAKALRQEESGGANGEHLCSRRGGKEWEESRDRTRAGNKISQKQKPGDTYKGLQGQIGLGTFRKDTQDEVQGPRGQVARC